MSGHSKWANIKHKKAASDAVKGRIFSKIAKEIMVAARSGGGDVSANITLRALVQKARAVNMPADNITRAIKKGTGELEGAAMEEIIYEGYAPGGVALVVQALSDNKNRTASEVRFAFTKHNASLAGAGSVMRSFRRRGLFVVSAEAVTEDRLLEVALDAGAEDVSREGDYFEVLCEAGQFGPLSDALAKAQIKTESAEITMIPDSYMSIADAGHAAQLVKFVQALEELEDVQNVYASFDIPDEIMAGIG